MINDDIDNHISGFLSPKDFYSFRTVIYNLNSQQYWNNTSYIDKLSIGIKYHCSDVISLYKQDLTQEHFILCMEYRYIPLLHTFKKYDSFIQLVFLEWIIKTKHIELFTLYGKELLLTLRCDYAFSLNTLLINLEPTNVCNISMVEFSNIERIDDDDYEKIIKIFFGFRFKIDKYDMEILAYNLYSSLFLPYLLINNYKLSYHWVDWNDIDNLSLIYKYKPEFIFSTIDINNINHIKGLCKLSKIYPNLKRFIKTYHDILWKKYHNIDIISEINKHIPFNPKDYLIYALDSDDVEFVDYLIYMGLKVNKKELLSYNTKYSWDIIYPLYYTLYDDYSIIVMLFIILILLIVNLKLRSYKYGGYTKATIKNNNHQQLSQY